jgi:hypothetical protein
VLVLLTDVSTALSARGISNIHTHSSIRFRKFLCWFYAKACLSSVGIGNIMKVVFLRNDKSNEVLTCLVVIMQKQYLYPASFSTATCFKT